MDFMDFLAFFLKNYPYNLYNPCFFNTFAPELKFNVQCSMFN
jgi:hypothetical protein